MSLIERSERGFTVEVCARTDPTDFRAGTVGLHVACYHSGDGGSADLSPGEARKVAAMLLAEADRLDDGWCPA